MKKPIKRNDPKPKRVVKWVSTSEVAKLPVHTLADEFPIDEKKIPRLADDMERNGQKVAILVRLGQLIDGRRRLKAAILAGIPKLRVEYCDNLPESKVRGDIRSVGIERRHLTGRQKADLALEEYYRAKESGEKMTIEEAAFLYDASPRTVHRHKAKREEAETATELPSKPRKKRIRLEHIPDDFRPMLQALTKIRRIAETDKPAFRKLKAKISNLADEINRHPATGE